MKKTFKRILSLILAATMLLSVMPVAFAQEEEVRTIQLVEDLIAEANARIEEQSAVFADDLAARLNAAGMIVDENADALMNNFPVSETEAGSEEEEPETFESGMFIYTVDENGKATVVDFLEDQLTSEITIPDELDGYPVVALEDALLFGINLASFTSLVSGVNVPTVTALHIGKNVESAGAPYNFDLERITVDENNEHFTAENDILYNKDKTKIIAIPLGKQFESFTLDFEVNEETFTDFLTCLYYGLRTDKFIFGEKFIKSFEEFIFGSFEEELGVVVESDPEALKALCYYAAVTLAGVLSGVYAKEFVVPEDSRLLCVDNYGALYTKDMSVLIKYPIGNAQTTVYSIPEGVDLSVLHTYADTLMTGVFSESNSFFLGNPFIATSSFWNSMLELVVFAGAILCNSIVYQNINEESVKDYTACVNALAEVVDNWFIESAPDTLTVHIPDSVMQTLPADEIFPSETLGATRLGLHQLSGANVCVMGDVTFSERVPGTLPAPVKVSDYNALVNEESGNYMDIDLEDDEILNSPQVSEETKDEYKKSAVALFDSVSVIRPIDEFEFCEGHPVVEPEEPEVPVEKDEAVIPAPSTGTINYGDSIILHVDETKIPEGGRVEWSASNDCFEMNVSADGKTCTISPESTGNTTFTVTIYDAEGNAVSTDTQEMTSKAGFWQKIVAFFKGIFNLTKVLPW